jgi:putative intracellular protease/amidase
MQKILTIATNADANLNGTKTGLWLSELTHFLDVVQQAGFATEVASPKGGRIPLDEKSDTAKERREPSNAKFLADPKFVASLERSMSCEAIDPSAYSAIYLAGGHGTMWDFRKSPALQKLISAFYATDKLIAGVCHGVAGFVDSVDAKGQVIVRGKVVTGFSNLEDAIGGTKKLMPFLLEDALKESGANYRKNLIPFTSRVEVDGRLITGQNPQSAKGVGVAVVERLGR